MSAIDLIVPVRTRSATVLQIRLGQQDPASKSSVAASSHCKSSRNSASGCSWRAKTPMKRRKTAGTAPAPAAAAAPDRRWFADNKLQLGDEVDHDRPFAPAPPQGRRATAQLGVVLLRRGRTRPLKSLHQRRIGDVAFVLIELPGGEKAARGTSALCSSCTTEDLPIPE